MTRPRPPFWATLITLSIVDYPITELEFGQDVVYLGFPSMGFPILS